ncbi:MAG: SH3 domain-containing protein [Gammaproteobacteria bacterium]|nr:SH3 domain-containing protein [Gammaproteobacteria bacterium]
MNRSGIHRRLSVTLFAAAGFALFAAALSSAEVGTTRAAVDMLSAPKSDAKAVGQLSENSRVEIIERRGAWLRVKHSDASGWLRLHQVRLGEGTQKTSSEGTKMLWNVGQTGRSGASGIVATTGVRGLSAADLKTAKPDPKQVQALEGYRANDAQAREQARAAGLRENQIAHLAKEE